MGSGSKAKDGERKKERLNDGNNNGQATHGARKHAWRTQAAWAYLMHFLKQGLVGWLCLQCVWKGKCPLCLFFNYP